MCVCDSSSYSVHSFCFAYKRKTKIHKQIMEKRAQRVESVGDAGCGSRKETSKWCQWPILRMIYLLLEKYGYFDVLCAVVWWQLGRDVDPWQFWGNKKLGLLWKGWRWLVGFVSGTHIRSWSRCDTHRHTSIKALLLARTLRFAPKKPDTTWKRVNL